MSKTTNEPWTVVEVKTASGGLAYKIGSGEMLEVGKGCCIIYDDYPGSRPSPRRKKADLIVTAVNAHEALVEELTKARALVEKWCHYQGNTRTLFDEHLGPIDAALRLAEGEKE